MGSIIQEAETRVFRSYRGGKLLEEFLGKEHPADSHYPEDWISSFIEAKNEDYVQDEGISRTADGRLLTQVTGPDAFGKGRSSSGVLIKYLDSAERLAIQVHPTDAFAWKLFQAENGKTECWHILRTREMTESPKVYLGFKPFVTREYWKDCYVRQDIQGMLDGMNAFSVKPGDTILVRGGMAHAIGAGCFLLEIQQPSDYTMRCEATNADGTKCTPFQIHYGAGEEAMLDCFDYTPRSLEEITKSCVLQPRVKEEDTCTRSDLVTYADTPYFALSRIAGSSFRIKEPFCLTLIALQSGGSIQTDSQSFPLKQGDRFFVPADTEVTGRNAELLLCYPPQKG